VNDHVSVVVLAGGRSRRMGTDKALLCLDGQPLLRRALERLRPLSDDLIVVADDPERLGDALPVWPVRVIGDVIAGKGALGGLYSGLLAARYEQSVVVACDMPFLNAALLAWMAEQLPGLDGVVPQVDVNAGPVIRHSLHAVYARSCVGTMREALEQDRLSIHGVLDRLRLRLIRTEEIELFDPRGLSLMNANTPEEWAACQRLAASI
jgi:molybdopterin-guanine dinucleotide biosynthesis protein A